MSSLNAIHIQINNGPMSEVAGNQITLPHLQRFSFMNIEAIGWEYLLLPFVMPVLEDINILDFSSQPTPWSHRPFTFLLNRSKRSLKSFSFRTLQYPSTELQDESIEPLLKALPEVLTLDLHAIAPPSTFVLMGKGGVVPQLVHLQCKVRPEALGACLEFLEHSFGGKRATNGVFQRSRLY
jgi:hypothetical protein